MTFKQGPTATQRAQHEAAHEAGHAVIAHHFGFQNITAQTQGLGNTLIWVDPRHASAQNKNNYLHLAAAGEAAEKVLMGSALTPQGHLKQIDFTLDQDVVRFLIAWHTGTLLYKAAQAPANWPSFWSVYTSAPFQQAWSAAVQHCEHLFQGQLSGSLQKARTYLQTQWSLNRGAPGHPFTILPATLTPNLQ